MSVNIGSTAQEILNEINNKVDKITYEAVATTSTAGLMSAADKVKLNNVLPLASVREDSSGNVVVSNDLKVQGGADFTNDVTMGSLTVDAGLQMNDDVEINYQYGIRWTDDNDSGLVSISRNEDTGKLEVHYANNSLPSGALATIGADQIKGIYLTGENRTIVGAESDVGIIWEGDGKLFKDENAITEITNTHFMTRVPIVAGNNVTFETDTENQVVKINATGGSGIVGYANISADGKTVTIGVTGESDRPFTGAIGAAATVTYTITRKLSF